MLDFIKVNYLNIIIVAVLVIGLLFLWYKGKKGLVKKIVLSLVVAAEKSLGSGTGPLKYAYVVENIYKVLPSLIRLLLTQKELDKLIEDAVIQLKEFLTSDKTLLGYDNEMKLPIDTFDDIETVKL